MPLVDLSKSSSILNQYLSEIRDTAIQSDRLRFRYNMLRCGELAAYEISKQLAYATKTVRTPLGEASVPALKDQPVIGAILRAGLILHEGLLHVFDRADNAFISAYRKHRADGSFEIAVEYLACPPLSGRTLILADPMLATGRSMVDTLKLLCATGNPSSIHLVTVIAARPGIAQVLENFPTLTIWACAVDEELNAHAYIVPGLGDAGDLSYGLKMQH
jgi:uracil phosphoribosyltransferase